jgi:UDPglucose--hexose-1-phosphate uridylyltransferase
MQELHTDELAGTTVIVAPGRATRPTVYSASAAQATTPAALASCPFCPEHETMTPPEVARVGAGAPDTPGWQVRVVPNLFPIVGAAHGVPGVHEVVVLSPGHDRQLDALSLDAATAAVSALRDRAAYHLAGGFVHAQPLVNHGRAAGASIEHPHAQLVALGFTPPQVDATLTRFADAGCDLVAGAIDDARRGSCLVRDGAAVTWCPPAGISPFFVRIALGSAPARFDRSTDDQLRTLAEALQDALARLHRALGDISYNVVVNTAPRDDDRPFHWWVDVVPRVGMIGGFEMGTGVMVNPVAPQMAAGMLRDA